MDVKSTFLNGNLKEVYMIQPKGYIAPRQKQNVWRFVKSLSNMKQASRA